MDQQKLVLSIAKAAADKKARDVVMLDMRGLSSSTDDFIIADAQTATQARAIADNIEEELDKEGVHFLHKEGYHEGEWILLDYGDAVAHIFKTDAREYYALERLWSDAKLTRYEG